VVYKESVFLNVPFDRSYKPLLEAAVFAIYDCGFVARCASEDEDSSAIRLEKIFELIRQSKYGIHDISRVELDLKNGLPRFNMPLELGIWLGAKRFGKKKQRSKRALVLDRFEHRFKIYCSDISGQDIRSHDNDPLVVIRRIRNWLRNSPDYKGVAFPGPGRMVARYRHFRAALSKNCRTEGLNARQLEFNDYSILVATWLRVNPK
jgi:hypothetical protein